MKSGVNRNGVTWLFLGANVLLLSYFVDGRTEINKQVRIEKISEIDNYTFLDLL